MFSSRKDERQGERFDIRDITFLTFFSSTTSKERKEHDLVAIFELCS